MFVFKVNICFVLMLCFARKINSDEHYETDASFSGLAFELILNKLETLQDKLIESEQKMAELSQTIDHKLAVLQTETKAAMKEHRDHIDQKLSRLNDTTDHKLTVLQTRTIATMKEHQDHFDQKLSELSEMMVHQFTVLQTETKAEMKEQRDYIDQNLSGLNETMVHQFTVRQSESKIAMKEHRDHIAHKLTVLSTESKAAMKEHRDHIDQKISTLSETMVHQFTTLKTESNVMLEKCKEHNDQKLNQLIQTVDDKFQALQVQSNKTDQSITVKHEQTQKEIQKLASKDGVILYKINPDMYYGTVSIPSEISIPSCKNNLTNGSGQYLIVPKKQANPFMGYCDQSVFGGGWLVFQYRFDGSVDFYRNWKAYRNGFGSLEGEFWLGLEHLHQLTSTQKYELLVELKDYSGVYKYARYSEFEIGSEAEKYALKKLGSYSGTAGDSLDYNKGMEFTTMDQDNDYKHGGNCAVDEQGAWWYNGCSSSNLNGIYKKARGIQYMRWYYFKYSWESMAYTRMSIREI